MPKTQPPQLVAHRGYLQRYPENSWRGLAAALQAGARWLEFDIQLCRDGEFILLHDANFQRTAGVDQSVFATDSQAIGLSVHEPLRFGARFAPTPVATLVEVLRRLDAYPAVRALVEIKQESLDHWGLATVMQKLAPLLAAHQPHCVLISFQFDALAWCREYFATLPIGWVLERFDADHRARAQALAPDFLICNERKIGAAQAPWDGPWQWMLYDIVDADLALRWAARGVTLIETAAIGTLLTDPRLHTEGGEHGL